MQSRNRVACSRYHFQYMAARPVESRGLIFIKKAMETTLKSSTPRGYRTEVTVAHSMGKGMRARQDSR